MATKRPAGDMDMVKAIDAGKKEEKQSERAAVIVSGSASAPAPDAPNLTPNSCSGSSYCDTHSDTDLNSCSGSSYCNTHSDTDPLSCIRTSSSSCIHSDTDPDSCARSSSNCTNSDGNPDRQYTRKLNASSNYCSKERASTSIDFQLNYSL